MAVKHAASRAAAGPERRPGTVTIVTDRVRFSVPPGVHRHDEFRRWATRDDFPPNVRVFFNQGELILDVSNEELETHVKVKGEIARVLLNLIQATDIGEYYSDGALLTNEHAELSYNPDGTFVRWETFDNATVHLVPREGAAGQFIEIVGTPDMVLEVVSRSSVKKDTVDLREAYHRAGVPEYWLIDGRGDGIALDILQRRKTRYSRTARADDWQWSNAFGRWFRLERTRGRREHWRYTLHIRDE